MEKEEIIQKITDLIDSAEIQKLQLVYWILVGEKEG